MVRVYSEVSFIRYFQWHLALGLDRRQVNATEATASEAFQSGDYFSAVKELFGLRLERRVEWLRANAGLHPILLFLRAIDEYRLNSTIETLHTVSHPLNLIAKLRMRQDEVCLDTKDDKVSKLLSSFFDKAIATIASKNQQPCIFHPPYINVTNPQHLLVCREKVRELAVQCFLQAESLSNPSWLTHEVEAGKAPRTFRDSDSWGQKRKSVAEQYLHNMEETLSNVLDESNHVSETLLMAFITMGIDRTRLEN